MISEQFHKKLILIIIETRCCILTEPLLRGLLLFVHWSGVKHTHHKQSVTNYTRTRLTPSWPRLTDPSYLPSDLRHQQPEILAPAPSSRVISASDASLPLLYGPPSPWLPLQNWPCLTESSQSWTSRPPVPCPSPCPFQALAIPSCVWQPLRGSAMTLGRY